MNHDSTNYAELLQALLEKLLGYDISPYAIERAAKVVMKHTYRRVK